MIENRPTVSINPDIRGDPDDKQRRIDLYRTLLDLQQMLETAEVSIDEAEVTWTETDVLDEGEQKELSVAITVSGPSNWRQYHNRNAPNPDPH